MSCQHWEIFKKHPEVRRYVSRVSIKSIENLDEVIKNVQKFLDVEFEKLLELLVKERKSTEVYELLLKYFTNKVLFSEFVYVYSKIPNPWYLIDRAVNKEIESLGDKAKGLYPDKELCWRVLGEWLTQQHGPIVAYRVLHSWLSLYVDKKLSQIRRLEEKLRIELPGLRAFWKTYEFRVLDEVFEDCINRYSLKVGFLGYFFNAFKNN